MSVRPVAFHPDGSVDVVFDEQGHSGTLTAAQVVWGDTHTTIALACPDGCGAVSWHPVGGGAAPLEVQQLFVDKTERGGCACGNVPASNNSTPGAHVHLNVSRMDGPARWKLDDGVVLQAITPLAKPPDKPTQFQVVYRHSDGLVLGTHPRGGVGPDNGVAVLHDEAEWDRLMRLDPAYLSADGDHIVGVPRP